jgi:hypothetical protein
MPKKNCKQIQQKRLDFTTLSVIKLFLLVVVPVWAIFLSSRTKGNTLVFVSDFESGFSEWRAELCCSHSAQIVNFPVRAGNQAVKFTLKKDDPHVAGSKRAELKLGGVPANSEQWYGFSVFLPSDYKQDPMGEIIAQWHDLPDRDLGESWRSPALCLKTQNGRFILDRHWDSKQVTKKGEVSGDTIDFGSYQTGKWTDVVFHVKWSYDSSGLFEVWKDGKLEVSRTGPTYYNDERGPYLKIGMYKGAWKHQPENSTTSERTIYFDEVRVGDASARYEDVAPRN